MRILRALKGTASGALRGNPGPYPAPSTSGILSVPSNQQTRVAEINSLAGTTSRPLPMVLSSWIRIVGAVWLVEGPPADQIRTELSISESRLGKATSDPELQGIEIPISAGGVPGRQGKPALCLPPNALRLIRAEGNTNTRTCECAGSLL